MKECKYKDHKGKRLLPESEFRKSSRSKDGLMPQCKRCADLASERWRKANNERKLEKQKQRLAQILNEFREWKREQGCYICDESEPVCLDMHHLDPSEKEDTVSNLIAKGYSKESWLKEANKCIVVCSNCHRKIHANIISV